jgi:WXG100 family type VII secretion target
MPAPRVRGDSDELATIAQQFGREADAIQQSIQRINQQVDQLQSGDWIGEGAGAFYREMEQDVFPALKRLATALALSDRTTRRIISILENTDEEAARLLRAEESGEITASGDGGLSPAEELVRDLMGAISKAGDAFELLSNLKGAERFKAIADSKPFKGVFAAIDGLIGGVEAHGRGVSTPAAILDGIVTGGFSAFSHPVEDAVGLVHGVTASISPEWGEYTAIARDVMPTNVASSISTGTIDTVDSLVRGDWNQLARHHDQNLAGDYGEVVRGYAIGFDALGAWINGDSSRLGDISSMAADGRLGPLAEFGDWLGGATYDLFN